MNTLQVEFLKTSKLFPAPFNPSARTDDASIKPIFDMMKVDGFWPYRPLVITKNNFIADGHRRWTCAKALDIQEVPCLRTDEQLDIAWCKLNEATMTIRARDIVEAVSKGMKAMPSNSAARKK